MILLLKRKEKENVLVMIQLEPTVFQVIDFFYINTNLFQTPE